MDFYPAVTGGLMRGRANGKLSQLLPSVLHLSDILSLSSLLPGTQLQWRSQCGCTDRSMCCGRVAGAGNEAEGSAEGML